MTSWLSEKSSFVINSIVGPICKISGQKDPRGLYIMVADEHGSTVLGGGKVPPANYHRSLFQ